MRRLLALLVTTLSCAMAADLGTGIQLYQEGNYKEAEAELSKVVGEDPHNAAALRYLGWAFVEQKKVKEAEDVLRQAQELEPGGQVNLAWARLYAEQQDFSKAQEALMDASGEELPYVRGLVALGGKQYRESAREFELFLADHPDHAYAHYYAGMAYNGLRRSDKVLTHFELFVKAKPDAPEARKVRAVLRTGR